MSISDGRRVPAESVTVRILGLAGSLRAGSTTRMAVRCALRGAEAAGAQVRLLDLASYELPFLGRENEGSGAEAAQRFLSDLRDADGVILGSPEIHGSMSGVLKNALDLTAREHFEGKMIGLIGVAGGRMGAGETLSHLRSIGRSLHAWVVPTQVSVADAGNAFDSRGEPHDRDLADRLESVGREVAHFGRLHKCGDHLQFVRDWEGAALSDSGSSRRDSPGEARP